MIQIRNLSYRYTRKRQLFNGLNLDLLPGKVYGLLGKNGAGKSSLIKNMAGFLIPTKGSCTVYGYETKHRETGFLEQLFFIPEECELPKLPIPDFIKIYAPFYPAFDPKQFYNHLLTFNVPPASHLQQLSFGQKKKVYIAFALAANTNLLIMDEPTNGLDIPSKLQFRTMVADSNRSDKITIMSTHQVRDLDDLINSILIMDNSEMLLQADREEINRRLFFFANAASNGEDIVYAQPTPTGVAGVKRNTMGQSSYLDLEILFNATLNKPELIGQIFQQ